MRVGSYGADRAFDLVNTFSKRQPNILSFMMEFTQDLDQAAAELGLYMAYVVWQMFETAYGKRYPKANVREIIGAYEANENWLMQFENVDERLLMRRMQNDPHLPQMNVIGYVVEALFETPEADDPDVVELSDEDRGYLFLLLKTVIDVLDKKVPD